MTRRPADQRRAPLNHIEAAEHLVSAWLCRSPEFRDDKAVWDRSIVSDPARKFAFAFLKECYRRSFPFMVVQGVGAHLQIIHWERGDELHPMEWAVVGLLGAEVARKQNVKVFWNALNPTWWHVEAIAPR